MSDPNKPYLPDGDGSDSKEIEGVTGPARKPGPRPAPQPVKNPSDGTGPDGEQG